MYIRELQTSKNSPVFWPTLYFYCYSPAPAILKSATPPTALLRRCRVHVIRLAARRYSLFTIYVMSILISWDYIRQHRRPTTPFVTEAAEKIIYINYTEAAAKKTTTAMQCRLTATIVVSF